jgi:hypothetical protein
LARLAIENERRTAGRIMIGRLTCGAPRFEGDQPMVVRPVLGSFLILLALAVGCGGRLNGVVDYDREHDYESIRDLAFHEDAHPSERARTDTRNRIRAEIARQLTERGYSVTAPDGAQAHILYHLGQFSNVRGGSMIGGRGSRASLAIEFRDPESGRAIWYGTVEQTWSDGLDVDERIASAVSVLLGEFPPDAKGKDRGGEKRVSE